MLYEDPRGEKFIDDPGYVADATPYVVAASSELPCPSCLTGLMQIMGRRYMENGGYGSDMNGDYDSFLCQSCERRVLIERRPS